MAEPSVAKKPRLSSPAPPSLPGESAEGLKPSEEEEDPDAVAPASTAGAHAKPLSALMGGAKGVGIKGKGKAKGKAGENDGGFAAVLAKLMEDNCKSTRLFPGSALLQCLLVWLGHSRPTRGTVRAHSQKVSRARGMKVHVRTCPC